MRRTTALLLGLTLSCTDTPLGFPDEEIFHAAVDDELTIRGEYCTSTAANVEYPVKVMFVVDGSGSQQFSDQNRQRVVAVEETINALIGTGNTYFSTVVFNASVTTTPTPSLATCTDPVFTNSPSELTTALNNLAEADTLTDYQGALGVAYSYIKQDMECSFAASPATLSRTKYVVIMISDGLPDPQCTVGVGNDFDPVNPDQPYLICENADFINCLLKTDCGAAGGADCSGGICSFGAATCFDNSVNGGCDIPNLFGQIPSAVGGALLGSDLAGANDYNQPYQILEKVERIMELEERFQVAELRVHAGLVLDPLADPAVIEIFGDASQAAPLMQQIAEMGGGRYMEFYGGDSIDFLEINFEAIKQQRVVRGFFADNRAARLTNNGLQKDTDFDGLTDEEEYALGTKPRHSDSDYDGYRDLIEVRQLGFSFDPNDPCFPPIDDSNEQYDQRLGPCTAADIGVTIFPCRGEQLDPALCQDNPCDEQGYVDSDRDGLRDCEEMALGTNRLVADTDADGLPDNIEVFYGLDPLRWDVDKDDDKDTIPNGRELEWHLNPRVQQQPEDTRDRYRYDRPEVARTIDGRSCYEFEVRRITLAFTNDSEVLPPELDGVGFNEVRLYLLENMADNLSGTPLIRTACVRAQYVPPSKKVPASGEVELTEADFWYLGTDEQDFQDGGGITRQFDPSRHCRMAQ